MQFAALVILVALDAMATLFILDAAASMAVAKMIL
jgi:hypothetical protein